MGGEGEASWVVGTWGEQEMEKVERYRSVPITQRRVLAKVEVKSQIPQTPPRTKQATVA